MHKRHTGKGVWMSGAAGTSARAANPMVKGRQLIAAPSLRQLDALMIFTT